MSRPKAEMSVEQKENGQIVEYVAYPYVEYDHVTFENGMQIEKALEDDVVMPTVTHDTSSWKVGQGDSDVSDSIVDSSVASMSIKGQTYQNILPSPTLRNSMTDGKTVQEINEGYDSVEVVDGNVKSAILKGQTLVNLFDINYFMSLSDVPHMAYLPNKIYSTDGNYLVVGGRVPYEKDHAVFDRFISGKTYTIICENTDVTIHVCEDTTISSNSKKGKGKIYFNAGSVVRIGFYNEDYTNTGSLKTRVIILEGDYTNVDIPYFEGMQSVKMPVLTTTGKNLFDGKFIKYNTTYGQYHFGSGTYTYSISDNDTSIDLSNIFFGDANGTSSIYWVISSGEIINTKRTVTNKNIVFYPNNEETFNKIKQRYNIQIEEGSVATEYEPYKSNILSCLEPVELGSVGEVKDELNLLTQQLTQRTETRPYQEGDELNSEFVTDMTNTRYKLAQEVVKTVNLSILDQDNQPTTQLNSFANGYIQVSSQGLIPSVDYEAPTSNSYYVDLAKPSTQYTMKNMTGTFTIDGTQYNASANGTFTTPSTLTNKFMVTSVVQSQPMLLEGDMTSEEVPYVEGIKSAFEGVDKVEIVSQNADNTLTNTTSFPITNPLRSLPNGVRDEIVLDRMSNKAKLIQRVGEDLTQLPSPIVTQVDIEGFPYVYKDGHIFLNTEVAPTTEVRYSINQSQIIESQSEDIVRHSKEIDNLYNLIATYVQVNYDSTLLNLKTKGV